MIIQPPKKFTPNNPLLRKSKEYRETLAGRHLYKKLKSMFKEIKRFNNSNPSKKQMKKKYKIMTEELRLTIKYYSNKSLKIQKTTSGRKLYSRFCMHRKEIVYRN